MLFLSPQLIIINHILVLPRGISASSTDRKSLRKSASISKSCWQDLSTPYGNDDVCSSIPSLPAPSRLSLLGKWRPTLCLQFAILLPETSFNILFIHYSIMVRGSAAKRLIYTICTRLSSLGKGSSTAMDRPDRPTANCFISLRIECEILLRDFGSLRLAPRSTKKDVIIMWIQLIAHSAATCWYWSLWNVFSWMSCVWFSYWRTSDTTEKWRYVGSEYKDHYVIYIALNMDSMSASPILNQIYFCGHLNR